MKVRTKPCLFDCISTQSGAVVSIRGALEFNLDTRQNVSRMIIIPPGHEGNEQKVYTILALLGLQILTKLTRFESMIATLLVSMIIALLILTSVSAPSVELNDCRKVCEWSHASAYSIYTTVFLRKIPETAQTGPDSLTCND